ncbi:hypothetical protein SLEP1_g60515 [Rubroshorea leprosula]|uniref:Uncharacterized protein n=1 Tax=Rubroshorea leprosula TaxID=152421 RepID=A0AAV5MWZ7_9ROSI|nr:hypothetical protein SLEP1_g60515 [Rubroshorea leprosula]
MSSGRNVLIAASWHTFSLVRWAARAVKPHQRLTSDRVRIPAELKHINKRRKRNQQGLP